MPDEAVDYASVGADGLGSSDAAISFGSDFQPGNYSVTERFFPPADAGPADGDVGDGELAALYAELYGASDGDDTGDRLAQLERWAQTQDRQRLNRALAQLPDDESRRMALDHLWAERAREAREQAHLVELEQQQDAEAYQGSVEESDTAAREWLAVSGIDPDVGMARAGALARHAIELGYTADDQLALASLQIAADTLGEETEALGVAGERLGQMEQSWQSPRRGDHLSVSRVMFGLKSVPGVDRLEAIAGYQNAMERAQARAERRGWSRARASLQARDVNGRFRKGERIAGRYFQ